jgi:putative transposase
VQRKVGRRRRDHLHKVTRTLVDSFDIIAIEDLRVSNMARRPKPKLNDQGGFEPNGAAAKGGLNRSIHDAGWATLRRTLTYKAEDAGRELIVVPAHYSSQRCWACGHTDAANRVTQSAFRCMACGHTDHADTNAALNILRAGLAQREATAEREANIEHTA